MLSDPISQEFLLEVKDQLERRFDDAHGRVRHSLNELKVEIQIALTRMETKIVEQDRRSNQHSEQLVVIETERRAEKESGAFYRQLRRERTITVTAVTSILVTIGLFVLKAWLHL